MKHYKRAKAHIGGFVERVNDPTFNWAWEIAVGVIDVVAVASSDSPLEVSMQETWSEFFDAINEGEATAVMHGCAGTLLDECPEDRRAEFYAALVEAGRIGAEGGRKRKPEVSPEPKKTTPAIRLVVNNTKRK